MMLQPISDAPAAGNNPSMIPPNEPGSLASQSGAPALNHDLIESILVATAHFICQTDILPAIEPTRTNCSEGPNRPPTSASGRRVLVRSTVSNPRSVEHRRAKHLGHLLLVTADTRPVHRFVLPLVPSAWPPTRAATNGRLDLLEHARSVGLLDRWLTQAPSGLVGHGLQTPLASLVRIACDRNHIRMLQWLQAHWPTDFVRISRHAFIADTIRQRIVNAAFLESPATDTLQFWTNESGVDLVACEIVTVKSAQEALKNAFFAPNPAVLRWWGNHTELIDAAAGHGGEVTGGNVWDYRWMQRAMHDGQFQVLDVCMELQEAGKVTFAIPSVADHQPLDPLSLVILNAAAANASTPIPLLVDELSASGDIDLLAECIRRHQSRGLTVEYSEVAMDLAAGPDVLDWWAKQSGLPLKYSPRALHQATIQGDIKLLDWWLAAFRQGRIPELKYDAWIMALASSSWKVDPATGEVIGASAFAHTWPEAQLRVLHWWDKSGLDLKLPGPQDVEQGVPSPIDVCLDVPILDFWLARAQRLASNTNTTIVHHFPHYTCVAMHRAAYWDMGLVLNWWLGSAHSAGLSLVYSPHRIMELAAMSPLLSERIETREASLQFLVKRLPEVQFRGSLLDWVELGFEDSNSSMANQAIAKAKVTEACAAKGIDLIGPLPPPEGGCESAKREEGEEFVFLLAF